MGNLKERLYEYFRDIQGNYDQEEIDNVIEIIDGLNDDLTDISKYEEVLILRLIDDSDLYGEVDDLYEEEFDDSDPFADL